MIDAKHWPDENAPQGLHLPDEQFVATRSAILQLLPRLFPEGCARHHDAEVVQHIIDEAVTDIGNIWKEHYDTNSN